MMTDVIREGNMNQISDLHVPLWSEEIMMKIGGIKLGLCGIKLNRSNKENFVCEYLFVYLLGWLFMNFY